MIIAQAEAENAAATADLVAHQASIPEPVATAKPDTTPPGGSGLSSSSRPSRWAALLATIYETFPLLCPTRGGSLTFIAFLTDPVPLGQILAHIGEPTRPPLLHPARGPPQPRLDLDGHSGHGTSRTTGQDPLDVNQSPEFDSADPKPVSDWEFDQSREGGYDGPWSAYPLGTRKYQRLHYRVRLFLEEIHRTILPIAVTHGLRFVLASHPAR